MLSMLTLLLSLTTVQPSTEIHWVCAGNSYMALEPQTVDFEHCDGWLVVNGEPVTQIWGAALPEDECTW